jgi:phosphoglucomutase
MTGLARTPQRVVLAADHGGYELSDDQKAMTVSPWAGKPAEPSMLVNVPRLVTAYYTEAPDPSVPAQRVTFGTSWHRGSPFNRAFNECHILAITQAICLYRTRQNIAGPLFLGIDSHALSVPACATALEVLAANGVEVMMAEGDEYTPTPVISHAILTYNRGRKIGFADGIVITPSHNPPHDGGFKYNPPNGGPAESAVTDWIEAKANEILEAGLQGVKRIPYAKALRASTTHRHDYLNAYITDLVNVLDMEAIRGAKMNLGVDPLGGAGVHYWAQIAERYGLNLTVVNEAVDPTFRFMTVDWDGQIRMDPSYDRVEAAASPEQKERLAKLSPQQVKLTELAGEKIQTVLTHAPGNGAPIGGLKLVTESGWFAARPSGTESIYKIYAESFRGAEHVRQILEEAQTIVNDAIAPDAPPRTDLKENQ